MSRVLVSDALSAAGLAVLKGAPGIEVEHRPGLDEAALVLAIPGFDALVVRSASQVTRAVLEAASTLKVIGRAGIGVDNVDVEVASRRGILVMNTPTGNAVTTAEHTLALLFALARKIPQATALLKGGRWEKSKLSGRELAGKTLGVLGLGTIGRIVAERARGLHMQVIGYDPVLSAARASQLGVELVSIDELITRADAITVHTPLTPETRGMVDDRAIAKMKPGVLLVNCARGGIYDEAALVRGLASGKLGGVALDVFVDEPLTEHPLFAFDNVVVTPHLGASTAEAQERVAIEICEQVVAYLASGTVSNAVNAPNVTLESAPKLAPYVALATKLGAFLAQVERVHPREIEVECVGEAAELGAKVLTRAAVAGLIAPLLDAPVNQVSAPHIAAERGVELREVLVADQGRRRHHIAIRARGESGEALVAEGIVGLHGEARLTRWREYELNADLGGHALVLVNENRPGVVGAVGTILGARSVNISQVHLGLAPGAPQAASVWNVDTPIPAAVLEEIRQAPNVARAWAIAIG